VLDLDLTFGVGVGVLCPPALEPARIVNNMTDQKVNMSATTVFTCDVTGTPEPSVVWTKNNHSVQEGSGRITHMAVHPQATGIHLSVSATRPSGCSSASLTFSKGKPKCQHPPVVMLCKIALCNRSVNLHFLFTNAK